MILLCELRSDHPERAKMRARAARELDFYRRYRRGTNRPRLRGMDGSYMAETEDGPVALYAVFDQDNRRGGVMWRVTCEVTSGGSHWQPPDTDEVTIVEAARSIGEALLVAHHAIELQIEQDSQRGFYESHQPKEEH